MIFFNMMAALILLVFYLYLFVRPQYVKRNSFFLIGAIAVLISLLLVGIFSIFDSRTTGVLAGIFSAILNVAAFGSGIAACYGGVLPGVQRAENEINSALNQASSAAAQGGTEPPPL